MEIYLVCIHDRHTDDKFKAFKSEKAAKKFAKEIAFAYRWDNAVENQQYGDWCLFLGDDYYIMVEEIELVQS